MTLEWRAVGERTVLHLGTVENRGGSFRFATKCDHVYLVGSLFADSKRKRCKRCLDHEATRDRRRSDDAVT